MKKLNFVAAAGLATSMMVSGLAFAAETETSTFDVLDQNQDGQLSAEEVSSHPQLSENLSVVDADKSGTIDRAEFSAFEPVLEKSEAAPEAEGSAN
ncbi:hypothetical protein ADIMK_2547 [Marinobacterium lacunae]|uniref:EF-hand domain-containing protein n=1 Tax=Marinobacterium lacunae TaxID=1232683 RepID=A0A081FWW8_9GAMM|nr:hypothetical protein [Marinobacterium lacunae]KEA63023.1 hypothetical protein ADIMK_2547 [Marinobacterium lacunae]MBR9883069.1 hypothetical protein [Oceanospirillales bacterium]